MAQTFTCANATLAEVSSKIGLASDGDTVIVPSQAATWSSSISFSKDIQIIGGGGDAEAGMDMTHAVPQTSNGATIITMTNNAGPAFIATYKGTDNMARIAGFVWEFTVAGGGHLLQLLGKSYRRRVGANIVGGLRVDHNRFKNSADPNPLLRTTTDVAQTLPVTGTTFVLTVNDTTPFPANGNFNVMGSTPVITYTGKTATSFTGCKRSSGTPTNIPAGGIVWKLIPSPIAAGMHVILWGASASGKDSYVTGSFDHNWWDFQPGSLGSEVNSFCSPGNPTSGGRSNGWGEFSWTQDYTYGGGDDTELALIYIEDNIFHRFGNNLGTLSGGGRFLVRYNASWGGTSGHGIDGGNMGPASWEYHNNYFNDQFTSQPGGFIGLRGGAQVLINNRFVATGGPIAGQTYRQYSSASQAIGHASGRNYLDDNWRNDPLTSAQINANPNAPGQAVPDGQIYNAVSVPGDSRQGAIYAQGGPVSSSDVTITTPPAPGLPFTTSARLVGLDGTAAANRWEGFVIINTSTLTTGSTGDQGTTGPATFNQAATGYIASSTQENPSTVTFQGGNGKFLLTANQNWEVRRVKYYLCNPGSGKLPFQTSGLRNAEDHTAGVDTGGFNYPENPSSPSGAPTNIHKYWCGQIGYGDWGLGNRTSSDGTSWSNATLGAFDETVMGGKHESLPTNVSNAGYGGGAGTPYPVASVNSAERRQVGPHWQAPGTNPFTGLPYNESIVSGAEYPAQAYGLQPYPNPMVSGEVSPPTNPRFTSADHLLAVPGTAISPTFQVATADFAGTVTFSITAGSFGTGTVAMSSSGAITGTPSGAAGDRGVTISATDGVDTKTQSFTLQVRAKPTITITAPTILSYTEPASITFQVNAAAATGFSQSIDNVEYFYGGTTSIGVVDGTAGSPYTFAWTSVAAGTYVVTAKATDNLGLATTSSSITITVTTGTPTLAAPNIVVIAGGEGGGGSPASPAKKILHWQATNNNRVSAVVTNKTYIDTLPFDGLILSVPSYQNLVGIGDVVNYTSLTSEVSPINGALTHVTHNYLDLMPGNSGMVDPFDSWTQTQANFVTVARVCQEQGLEGIFFDNEEYNIHWWTYPTDVAHAGTHTVAEYKDQWRLRGNQVMTAIIAQWPQAKVVHTIGPNRSVSTAPFSGAFSGDPNWLGGYFFAGMFEAAPTGNHVISGGELYYLRTPTHFSTTKSFLDTIYTQNSALFSSSSVNPTWLANDDLSWGIYDQDSGNPVNGGVPMTSAILQTTLQNAVPNADEFVWNYSESGLEWLTSGGGSVGAWQNAVWAARTTLVLANP